MTAVLVTVWGFFIIGPATQAIEERQHEGLVAVANATGVALQTSNQPADEVLARIAASDNLRRDPAPRQGLARVYQGMG